MLHNRILMNGKKKFYLSCAYMGNLHIDKSQVNGLLSSGPCVHKHSSGRGEGLIYSSMNVVLHEPLHKCIN